MSFSPDDLNNLKAWWSALSPGSSYSHGDPVSSLADQSGNGHDLQQSTYARRPIYQSDGPFPVIHYDKSGNDWMITGGSLDLKQSYTILSLGRTHKEGYQSFLRQGTTGSSSSQFHFGWEHDTETSQPLLYSNSPSSTSYVHGPEIPDYSDQFHLWAMTVPNEKVSDASLYHDGEPIQTLSGSERDNLIPDGTDPVAMGLNRTYNVSQDSTFPTGRLDFKMVETLIYRQSLSDSAIRQVWSYYLDKYLKDRLDYHPQDTRGLRFWSRGDELASSYQSGENIDQWLTPATLPGTYLEPPSGQEPIFDDQDVPSASFESTDSVEMHNPVDLQDVPFSCLMVHGSSIPSTSLRRRRLFEIRGNSKTYTLFHEYTQQHLRKMVLRSDSGMEVTSQYVPRRDGFNVSGVLFPTDQEEDIQFIGNGQLLESSVDQSGDRSVWLDSNDLRIQIGPDYVGEVFSLLLYKDDLSASEVSSLWSFFRRQYFSAQGQGGFLSSAIFSASSLVYTFKGNISALGSASLSSTDTVIRRTSISMSSTQSLSSPNSRNRASGGSLSATASTRLWATINKKFGRGQLSSVALISLSSGKVKTASSSPGGVASLSGSPSLEHGVSPVLSARGIWNPEAFEFHVSGSSSVSSTTSMIFYGDKKLQGTANLSATADVV